MKKNIIFVIIIVSLHIIISSGCPAFYNPWEETTFEPDSDPTPIELETVFAVNCGGDAYTGSDSTEYSGGTARDSGASVSGTPDPTIYSTERYGECTYSVSISNGDYLVTLQFAENYHTSPGSRAFNVFIEGTGVISNLDLYAEVGGNAAYVTKNKVRVSDGEINIEFVTVMENAMINAIKVSSVLL